MDIKSLIADLGGKRRVVRVAVKIIALIPLFWMLYDWVDQIIYNSQQWGGFNLFGLPVFMTMAAIFYILVILFL